VEPTPAGLLAKYASVGMLLLLMHAANVWGKDRPNKEPIASVLLKLSVEVYDPSAPSNATIKCVVRNTSDRTIQAPVSYDGRQIQLFSAGMTFNKVKIDKIDVLRGEILRLKRKLEASTDPNEIEKLAAKLSSATREKKELEAKSFTALKPGQERVIFELPLDDILLRGKTKDGEFRWGWPRRPAPPLSPIYRKAGSRDLVEQASFLVRMTIDGQNVTSKSVSLKIKTRD
jgi:hypothetical protein